LLPLLPIRRFQETSSCHPFKTHTAHIPSSQCMIVPFTPGHEHGSRLFRANRGGTRNDGDKMYPKRTAKSAEDRAYESSTQSEGVVRGYGGDENSWKAWAVPNYNKQLKPRGLPIFTGAGFPCGLSHDRQRNWLDRDGKADCIDDPTVRQSGCTSRTFIWKKGMLPLIAICAGQSWQRKKCREHGRRRDRLHDCHGTIRKKATFVIFF